MKRFHFIYIAAGLVVGFQTQPLTAQPAGQSPFPRSEGDLKKPGGPLAPVGNLRVTVADNQDNPLPNATVFIMMLQSVTQAKSDGNGSYHFDNVSRGEAILLVVSDGFEPQIRYNVITPTSSSVNIKLNPGGGIIEGKVTTADGQPVPGGVEVGLFPYQSDTEPLPTPLYRFAYKTFTDAQGNYRLKNIPERDRLKIDLTNRNISYYRMFGKCSPNTDGLKIRSGQVLHHDIIAATGIPVEGYISDRFTGAPLPGVPVTTEPYVGDTTTDSNGYYKINNAYNKTTLIIKSDKYNSSHFSLMSSMVECNSETIRADLRLEPIVYLSGTVVNPEGKPVGNATVSFANPDDPDLKVAVTDNQGKFRLQTNPKPGESLRVFSENYLGYYSEPMDVGIDGLDDIKVHLKRGSTVKGKITDTKGKPIPESFVIYYEDNDRPIAADSQGDFVIKNCTKNTYARILAPGFIPQNIDILDSSNGEKKSAETLRIRLEPSATLSGRIVMSDGSPFDLKRISHIEATDPSGESEIIDVTQGGYFQNDYCKKHTDYLLTIQSQGTKIGGFIPVKVTSGTSGVELMINPNDLPPAPVSQHPESTPAITGKTLFINLISAKTGQPVTNASLDFINQAGLIAKPVNNKPGVYRVNNPGTPYYCLISAKGFRNYELRGELNQTKKSDSVTVRLADLISYSGRVIDKETSSPISRAMVYVNPSILLGTENYSAMDYTFTDESGRFLFKGLDTNIVNFTVNAGKTYKTNKLSTSTLSETHFDVGEIVLEKQ